MTETTESPQIPFVRPYGIDPSPELCELARRTAVTRVRTVDGQPAWLLTRYEDVRTALADPRFQALGSAEGDGEVQGIPPIFRSAGSLAGADGWKHQRLRRVLIPAFTARRMNLMRSRVRRLVDDLLDAMAGAPPPVDLHQALSFPLPVRVISELLGVADEDTERFAAWSDAALMTSGTDYPAAAAAWNSLTGHLRASLESKRVEPAGDLLSDLAASHQEGRITEEEAIGLAAVVLVAGYGTTVAQLEYGVVALLRHPEQLKALKRDPRLAPRAVEEILRLFPLGAGVSGLQRFTATDVEIAGTVIPAGSRVFLSFEAAAFDLEQFDDPERFDLKRQRNPHLTFGHGPHHCLGATLARIELETVFSHLFQRFPTLRLAVPLETLETRTSVTTGGFVEIPVTW